MDDDKVWPSGSPATRLRSDDATVDAKSDVPVVPGSSDAPASKQGASSMLTQQTSGIGATPGKTGASTVLKDAGESSRAGDKAAWEDADFVVRPATETDCEELINIFMRKGHKNNEESSVEKASPAGWRNANCLRRDGFEGEPWFDCIVVEHIKNLDRPDKERAVREAYALGNDIHRREEVTDKARTQRGVIIGSALVYFSYERATGRGAVLEDVFVVPEFRGRGLAKILFRKSCELALSRACRTFRVKISSEDLLLKTYLEERRGVNVTLHERLEEYAFDKGAMEAIAGADSS
jgi:GNAT superfamily N-acetyltransferase